MKSKYNDKAAVNNVIGNIFKNPKLLDATDKYSLGRTPSGKIASYKINSKIDTPTYLLSNINSTIHEIAQHIYFDWDNLVWTSDKAYKKQNEDRYLKKRTPQTIGQRVANKYSKYINAGLLDTTILASDTYATEHDMLIALAESFNRTEGNYGFVYNNRLYLTKPGVRLTNP